MHTASGEIFVNAPVHDCYEGWAHFDQFPKFMKTVKEVRQTGPNQWHWRVDDGMLKLEWDSEVTQNVPDQVIAWKGTTTSGEVKFTPQGGGTLVHLTIEYIPPAGVVGEVLDDVFHLAKRDLADDLASFKSLIESQKSQPAA